MASKDSVFTEEVKKSKGESSYPGECTDVGGLVTTRQPPLVPVSVRGDVFHVPQAQLFNRPSDLVHAAVAPH